MKSYIIADESKPKILNRKCVRCGREDTKVHIGDHEGICNYCYARYRLETVIIDPPENRIRLWMSWTAFRLRQWFRKHGWGERPV